ncbi:hypothetical protein CBOM_01507 [Ceraceosorus bombacis]|uniref:GH16 domain-containing protein n=1 Tax=Ceraceosorus bombacis TaxID=401625 RepID=A0A0N7L9E9_9BASI|nr:hypothetical protein CBOM_01507 [Ceraceosorus bombacis]
MKATNSLVVLAGVVSIAACAQAFVIPSRQSLSLQNRDGSRDKNDDSNHSHTNHQSGSSSSSSSATSSASSRSSIWTLHDSHRGENFFDGFEFWSLPDPTHGQVSFQTQSDAEKLGLISASNRTAARMKVSSEELSLGQDRPSVRFQGNRTYNEGLIVFDVVKMPVGCGTWPALWTVGDDWPLNSEIDVLESVGDDDSNQMTVHTKPGCTIAPSTTVAGTGNTRLATDYSGRMLAGAADCDAFANGNAGCAIKDTNERGPSFGSKFNDNGGGVFAMSFTPEDGVSIWFWGRNSTEFPKEFRGPNSTEAYTDVTASVDASIPASIEIDEPIISTSAASSSAASSSPEQQGSAYGVNGNPFSGSHSIRDRDVEIGLELSSASQSSPYASDISLPSSAARLRDASSQTLDPSTWGTPTARFANSNACDFGKMIGPQRIVMDITLFGKWAGNTLNVMTLCIDCPPEILPYRLVSVP